MKSLKSTKGFTLVELIVVIAILGILAAVAVPAYSGYLTKAKEAGDFTKLDAVKTAVQAAHAKTTQPTYIEVTDGTTDSITVGTSSSHTAMSGSVLSDFQLFYGGAADTAFSIDLETGGKAVWDGSTWTISAS